MTGGVNSKKGCFGRKTKFFPESQNFARNQETWEIFRETRSKEVKISENFGFFGNVSQNIWDNIPDFWEDFYLHMVLLKQHFLELSTPIQMVIKYLHIINFRTEELHVHLGPITFKYGPQKLHVQVQLPRYWPCHIPRFLELWVSH